MLLAGAIQAAMLRASRARLHKLLTKGCTRAVDTDTSVGRGKFVLLSEILQALLSQIDGTQDF